MNKFNFINGDEEVHVESDDVKLVHDTISNYLDYDIDVLLHGTDGAIFGGAVRDSLSFAKLSHHPDTSIHDVDIMVLPNTARAICEKLQNAHFVRLPGPNADISSMYVGLNKIINEPWTYMRGDAIVQLIRPSIDMNKPVNGQFMNLLSNVDISACGVAYFFGFNLLEPKRMPLIETVEHAIEHCKDKVFWRLPDNVMHQKNRIENRVAKLLDRGWKEIKKPSEKEIGWGDAEIDHMQEIYMQDANRAEQDMRRLTINY